MRGTPQQIIEKYQLLARDSQLSNDRIAAENFLQHAEHYTRLLAEAQRELAAEQEARQQQQNQQRDREAADGTAARDRRDRGRHGEGRHGRHENQQNVDNTAQSADNLISLMTDNVADKDEVGYTTLGSPAGAGAGVVTVMDDASSFEGAKKTSNDQNDHQKKSRPQPRKRPEKHVRPVRGERESNDSAVLPADNNTPDVQPLPLNEATQGSADKKPAKPARIRSTSRKAGTVAKSKSIDEDKAV